MSENEKLVERLLKAADQAGMLLSDPPRPSPTMALLAEAAAAEARTKALEAQVKALSARSAEPVAWEGRLLNYAGTGRPGPWLPISGPTALSGSGQHEVRAHPTPEASGENKHLLSVAKNDEK